MINLTYDEQGTNGHESMAARCAGTAVPERDHIFRARDSSDLTTADVKPRRCGWGGSRLLTPSCPCSLDLRQERQRGVAMGTVDRGLLWFDADRTPASEIPGLPGVDAMGDRTRGDTRNPLGTGSARAAQGHRPGIPDEPRNPAHRGATT
jgi:hypothetical protein